MKIYQVKYSSGTFLERFVYYKAKNETDITINTLFYKGFSDCKEQNNKFVMGLEAINVKEALIRSFMQK